MIHEPVFIAEGAVIEDSVVGPYASIGANAVLRQAIVRDSIIGDGAHVERVTLQESLIGNAATVLGSFDTLNIGDCSELAL